MSWAQVQSELERIATSGDNAELERIWADRVQVPGLESLIKPYYERGKARLARGQLKRENFSNLANYQRAGQPFSEIEKNAEARTARLGNWGSDWDKKNQSNTMLTEVIAPGLKLGAAAAAIPLAGAAAGYVGAQFGGAALAKAGAAYAAGREVFANKPRMPENSVTRTPDFVEEREEKTTADLQFGGAKPGGSGGVASERTTGTRVREGGAKPDGFNPHEPDFSGKNQNFGGFDL